MTDITIDEVVRVYLGYRKKKEALDVEYKAKVDNIKKKMDKIESWIKKQAGEMGVTSFKTDHGTAFIKQNDFASVGDWDAILDFVKQNNAYDMFQRRINKNAVREYIKETGSVPAGVDYGTRMDLLIRKPKL